MAIRKCPACTKEFRKGTLVLLASRTKGGAKFAGKMVCPDCARSALIIVLPQGTVGRMLEPAGPRPLGKRERMTVVKDVLDKLTAQLKGFEEVIESNTSSDEQLTYLTGKVEVLENTIAMLKGEC